MAYAQRAANHITQPDPVTDFPATDDDALKQRVADVEWPTSTSTFPLTVDQTQAQVWAQLGSEPPRIVIAGALDLATDDGLVTATIRDASKPQDASGDSLLLSGTISRVRP